MVVHQNQRSTRERQQDKRLQMVLVRREQQRPICWRRRQKSLRRRQLRRQRLQRLQRRPQRKQGKQQDQSGRGGRGVYPPYLIVSRKRGTHHRSGFREGRKALEFLDVHIGASTR